MVCENCGERDAVIHLTQIVGGTKSTIELCELCAAEKGVETGASVAKSPMGDFLAALGRGEPSTGLEQACPSCGATLDHFRETGRLGCAQCYVTFEAHLRDLLRRLHGSSVHAGERYQARRPAGAPVPAPEDAAASELSGLRDQLKRAVDAENFELAAELRDRIRVLE